MTRPQKQTVDYFPHSCKHGKTIFILEERFGKIGYGFWFKLLEELGSTEGHFLDMNDDTALEFLGAKTGFPVSETLTALDLLARLNAIDQNLWSQKIVWCQNFVDNIKSVYEKRVVSAPEKPDITGITGNGNGVNDTGKPQSKVKYSKVKKSMSNSPQIPYSKIKELWNMKTKDIFNSIQGITGKRKTGVTARWNEGCNSLEKWEAVINICLDSNFLKGWDGFNFDWLIKNSDNFMKVQEGKYKNKQDSDVQYPQLGALNE